MGKAAKRYAEKADTEYAYDSEAFRAAVGKAYDAGHRANRVTKDERAVAKAVRRYLDGEGGMGQIWNAANYLRHQQERAKGGAR